MKANPVSSIPSRNSKAEEWIEWHKQLKSNFGKKQANALFVKAWKLRGSNSITTNEMRTYLTKNGINLEKSTLDIVVDKGSDITDYFGDMFNVSKYMGIGLAVVLLGGTSILIFNIAKNPVGTIGAVAKLKGK